MSSTQTGDGTVVRAPQKWVGPVPADEEWTAPYWEALRQHRLSVQRCTGCGSWHHPPVLGCPSCGSADLVFEPVSGVGRLYSVTVSYREFGLQMGVPWIAAYVELEEGPRLATNIVNALTDEVAIGQTVSVVYQDYDEIGLTLAFFEPETPCP